MTSYLSAAGAVSTTTEDGAQFSTDGLLGDDCWPKLHAAYKEMWRVQYKYFAEVLKIKEVRARSLVLHAAMYYALHRITRWCILSCNRMHPRCNPYCSPWDHTEALCIHAGCRL